MELNKQVESLRRATASQREAAARAAPRKKRRSTPPARATCGAPCRCCAMPGSTSIPCSRSLVGMVFVFYVRQTREILADLEQDRLLLGVLAVWAASI